MEITARNGKKLESCSAPGCAELDAYAHKCLKCGRKEPQVSGIHVNLEGWRCRDCICLHGTFTKDPQAFSVGCVLQFRLKGSMFGTCKRCGETVAYKERMSCK